MTARILIAIALLAAATVAALLLFTPDAPETLGRFVLLAAAFYALGSAGVIVAHEWGRA
jgi:hypothetical protein